MKGQIKCDEAGNKIGSTTNKERRQEGKGQEGKGQEGKGQEG